MKKIIEGKETYASKSAMAKHEKTESKKVEKKEEGAGIKSIISKKIASKSSGTKTLLRVKKK
jgi:hypothetical protein